MENLVLPNQYIKKWFKCRFGNDKSNISPVYGKPQKEFTFFLEKVFTNTSRPSILDIACGDGRYTIPVALKGGTVYATDVLPEAIERCRKYAKSVGVYDYIHFTVGDAASFESKHRYNGIICGSCNLHLFGRKTAENILKKIESLLLPNGVVFISLSADIERSLPNYQYFFYNGEANYSTNEAISLLKKFFSNFQIYLLTTKNLNEQWDIPPEIMPVLQSSYYNRKENEILLIAIKEKEDEIKLNLT